MWDITHHIQQRDSFTDLEHDGHVAADLVDEILDSLIASTSKHVQ
jgi:hypothetical protein